MEKQRKKERLQEAKVKFIFEHGNGDLEFALWRATNVVKLGAFILSPRIASMNEKVFEDNPQISGHDVVIRVLNAFIFFSVFSAATASVFGVTDGTIPTFTRFYASVATTSTRPRAGGSKK